MKRFTPEWLKMTHSGKFCPNSGLDWLRWQMLVILQVYPSFPPKWGSDWLGMANFTWFTTFPIFCHQSILFLEKSSKFSFLGRGYIGKFFEFFNLFRIILHWSGSKWPYNGKFCQKSDLDWLQMTNFGHFAVFPSFLQKWGLDWLGMANFTWFTTFPSFATNSSHFKRNLKNFIPGGGVHWQIFWVFQLFWIISHWSSSKWSTKANFATEVVWIRSKCVILVKCQQKLKYLSRILTDLHQTFRRGLVSPNWSKRVQGVVCYNQNWWKLKYLSRISIDLHQQFFFEFFNYFESFHTKASQNDLQW